MGTLAGDLNASLAAVIVNEEVAGVVRPASTGSGLHDVLV